jgi:hypothetical protein
MSNAQSLNTGLCHTNNLGECSCEDFLPPVCSCCSWAACDKAKDLYDTVRLEEKQFNKPHATKLYRQIVEEYPDSPYANQAKTRLTELEKAR